MEKNENTPVPAFTLHESGWGNVPSCHNAINSGPEQSQAAVIFVCQRFWYIFNAIF